MKVYREEYDYRRLHCMRLLAIKKARKGTRIGLLLSSLGRQTSVGLAEDLINLLHAKNKFPVPILINEFTPNKLKTLNTQLDAFVQIGCPRLSIDWGESFDAPLLSPYEAFVAFGDQPYLPVYPMDYYAKDGGPWTNYNTSTGDRRGSLAVKEPVNSKKAELMARLLQRQQQRRQMAAAAAAANSDGAAPQSNQLQQQQQQQPQQSVDL
ncbi:putative diphthamide synthesis domain-containing protein [Eimeria maxima]|uniref:Putative diphthamide synthesis domain-containing protein n=1 Tax=Eimeria maxima TaxID=5804 RepID=U6LWD0_EIMMA|nr:putative diphthamide synthesis domain-containing protein [Eimeria maxima]CDJ56026.1 putative diphthamide synthesis domain-containing protein [Eimeria maxima]